jgi:phosphopantetheinyl transferase
VAGAGERPTPPSADEAAATLGALSKLARHSRAAAELAALLKETASEAVAMLSATAPTRPSGIRPIDDDPPPGGTPPGNGNGASPSVGNPPGTVQPQGPRPANGKPPQGEPPADARSAANGKPSATPAGAAPGGKAPMAGAGTAAPGGRPPMARAGAARLDGRAQVADGGWRSVLRVSMQTMPYLMDHCFYALPPDWPTVEDRWPVVPATTVAQHMMDAAEAASPGMRAVAIREARFLRWLIAAPARDVEITVKPAGPGEVAVVFGGYARSTVELAPAFPAPPGDLWRHDPATERPPTISAKKMYDERLMFHGPQFQAVTAVHAYGDMHVRGQVTAPAPPGALLDNALQLIGNWIITTQATRTVALPVRLGAVRFHGPHPAPGTLLEVVARIRHVDHDQIVGDAQLIHDGRLWARIEGVVDRRFDSHPTARIAERFPQRHGMSERQPEGWVLAYEYWTDLVTRGMAARGVLGAKGGDEYERKPPATRKQWLLGRIAAKDAVRFRQWDAGHGDVYPIELTVENEPNGRPRVRVRPGKDFLDCDVSLGHCADVGVAIARPYPPAADRDAPGVGIDVAEIATPEQSTVRLVLTSGETALLDRLGGGGGRDLWFTRFWAAKEAVAKAEGTGLGGRPRDFVVTAAGDDSLTVRVGPREYAVGHREIANPPDLPPRRYIVAWTWGPGPDSGPVRD